MARRPSAETDEVIAREVTIRGVVQGVGFRPYVYRLAHEHHLAGWVCNDERGVRLLLEGPSSRVGAFLDALPQQAPPASTIIKLDVCDTDVSGLVSFELRASTRSAAPTVRISPDLAVCEECLAEMRDPSDRRHGYAYINCTNCGPRYSLITALPYDRPKTTMAAWPLCSACAAEYGDPLDRRFHAQPVACPTCGPTYRLLVDDDVQAEGPEAIKVAAAMLREGRIVAVKGVGGYHLVSDARNVAAVAALRERKYRKEKPFAIMARDLDEAEAIVDLNATSRKFLVGTARPIVLAPAKMVLPLVAPDQSRLGVMLPYAPLHHLLFDAGAPAALVMTSGNRSSEPIAFTDDEARTQLEGIADAFLVGERPIARRVDDSVVTVQGERPMMLRRSRGYSPGVVAALPPGRPILAVGADLKNAIALVVEGDVVVSQHLGDLADYRTRQAFEQTIDDLLEMYDVPRSELVVVHDLHPEYVSTGWARERFPEQCLAVQHHHAHLASVLAEHSLRDQRVVGLALDGTGYGCDGTIWGCEILVGSLEEGFQRRGHLPPVPLPGGDAAARYPVQAAAGFLAGLSKLPDLRAAPIHFPERFDRAMSLVERGVRCFPSSSAGRMFDAVAALLGFTREASFEGQPAMWLEHQAEQASGMDAYPVEELASGPLLEHIIADRIVGRPIGEIAGAFHASLARVLSIAAARVGREESIAVVALSGGVFQNRLLVDSLEASLQREGFHVLTNEAVPVNDGGISLGQAALASTALAGHPRGGS
ncbi:Carbamoyltransferase HypF [Planctomycetes bacterium Pan216]|uniref:Carbamoyltransferase n=1 Tax=Kolteria novifilia TaxID=2527975 RepID=A0A518BBS3_9BACT|nr:Carbamoyltransferase HypF [Planctomycetes bacterium Pan216]